MSLRDVRSGRPLNDIENMAAEFSDLLTTATARIDRYARYKEENEEIRNPDMEFSIRDLSDYGRRPSGGADASRHRIPLPLGLAQTVKHTFRVSGQLPDLVVDERDTSPGERYRSDSMEKIAWAVIRASGSETLFSSGGWDGSQLGTTVFDCWMDVGKNMPVVHSVNPAGFIPVLGAKDPHDFSRVYQVWDVPVRSLIQDYKDKQFRGEPVKVGDFRAHDASIDAVPMSKVVKMTDKQNSVMFAYGGDSVVGLEEFNHNYGFVPFVAIPNIGKYEDVFGWSDYELVRSLIHYLSALISRQADVIRSVANGAMIERGTGQTPEAIKNAIARGGVIPSRKEGSIDPIEAPQMPAFASEHQDTVMQLFKMVGFTPDAAWGEPGSQSGQDRGLQLQPLLEYTAMKQMNWGRGLSRLFEMVFKMIETQMIGQSTYSGTRPSKRGTGKEDAFSFTFGPNTEPVQQASKEVDALTGEAIMLSFPRTPKELFAGYYCMRFVWRNRLDPDDPSYVTSELSKFSQGVQSLKTTLERLGSEAPEDEMRRIEDEAERFPWINQGMIALLKAQTSGQGAGGGNPGDTQGQMNMDALGTMTDPNSGIGNDASAQLGAMPGAPTQAQYG